MRNIGQVHANDWSNQCDSAIEVGLTNGVIDYQALIRPMGHWQFWSDESQRIHGIDRQELIREGRSAEVVANELNQLVAGSTVYCDSINWDSFWLRVLFSDNGIHQRFEILDIQSLLKDELTIEAFLAEKNRLIASGQYRLHRALDDAQIIAAALNVVVTLYDLLKAVIDSMKLEIALLCHGVTVLKRAFCIMWLSNNTHTLLSI